MATKPAHSVEELQEITVGEGGEDISVLGGVLQIVGKVLGAIVQTIADIFDFDTPQIASNEFFTDNNFIGFDNELGELVAVKDAAAPVDFKISPEKIAAEIIAAEKNNYEVKNYVPECH